MNGVQMVKGHLIGCGLHEYNLVPFQFQQTIHSILADIKIILLLEGKRAKSEQDRQGGAGFGLEQV